MVHAAFSLPVRALVPPICILCGGPGQLLQSDALDMCAGCVGDLTVMGSACTLCAEPLTSRTASGLTCGRCLRKRPRFDFAFCAFRYQYPIDHLMRALKFHGRITYGRVLGELFVQAIQAARHDAWPDLILPVPLAEARFRERGFNQAIEIGTVLERRLGIPLRADVVVRTRNTLEQTGLDHESRRRNLRKAFAISRQLAVKHVAILDDVITTGSTMNELARTLRRAGAKRIEAWAIARTAQNSELVVRS